MLDKSLAFKHVIMRIEPPRVAEPMDIRLPDGFSFRFFSPADAAADVKHWASIETSVLEFASEEEAGNYFKKSYLPFSHELQRRLLFIQNPEGLPIATSNAWYADSHLGYQAVVNWVGVRPEYQGKGLGKAIVQKTLEVFRQIEPGKPVWLHTQTWSYPAIKLYHKLGFNMVKTDTLANMNSRDGVPKVYTSEFTEAIEVLKAAIDDDYIDILASTAV